MARSKLAGALIVALAIAVHAPSLGGSFLLDDGVQIYKNRAVTGGAPLAAWFVDRGTTSSRADYNTRIYRPLRNLAFRVVVLVGGVRPLAFKLVNLLLYALSALLVLAMLRRLVEDERAAAWATALWVVLPVHVEPVVYASALGDQLSLALELGALVVAIDFLRAGGAGRALAATVLAAAAMLAKEMAVTEPALVLLAAIALGARASATDSAATGATWRRAWMLAGVHGAVALAYVALRTHVVGAVGQDPITAHSLAAGLRDAPWLLVHYLWICVAPLGHAAAYRVAPPGALALVVTLAAIALAFAVAWRSRRVAAVGLAWFAVALVPVLHLVPLWADLADRFVLFPSVGLALALAAAPATWPRRAPLVAGALVLLYGAASVVEARPWRNDSLLWRYAVDRQPNAPLARSNLAAVLLGEGRIDEAAAQLEALHALGFTRADTEVKRAYVLSRLKRDDEAARAIAAALRLDPSSGLGHAVAGQLAFARGEASLAAREHGLAQQAAPLHPATGLLGYTLQRAADARVEYLRALTALTFDDADGATRAARSCLARAPMQPLCGAALGEALTLQGPLDGEARTLLDRCLATVPEGPDRARCREAKWGARR